MLLIKLIIAASENHHDIMDQKMVVSKQFTQIIATKGVCVFVLVS